KIKNSFCSFNRPFHGHKMTGFFKTPENNPRNVAFESFGGRTQKGIRVGVYVPAHNPVAWEKWATSPLPPQSI
ncbi:MAG: hypothetical protein PVH27_09530, partial [Desulfobacterales bacterium]